MFIFLIQKHKGTFDDGMNDIDHTAIHRLGHKNANKA